MKKTYKRIVLCVSILVLFFACNWFSIYRTVTHFDWTATKLSGFSVDFYIPQNWSLEIEDKFIYIYQIQNDTKEIIGIGIIDERFNGSFSITSKFGDIVIFGGLIEPESNFNSSYQAYTKCNVIEFCIVSQIRDKYFGQSKLSDSKYETILFIFFNQDVSIEQVKQFMESFRKQ
ncbi:MAG: hypothetical protein LBR25_01865 [Erysipelotrichaceae bacterium]|nr:hypothetical protein [Erysipelotrichaceae bacterium]